MIHRLLFRFSRTFPETKAILLAAMVGLALVIPSSARAEEIAKAIIVQTADIYTQPGMKGTKIGRIHAGTVVSFMEKECTERHIQHQTAEGWVLDLAMVPITGPAATPQKVFAMAQMLENHARQSGAAEREMLDQAMMLYVVLYDYFPNSQYTAQVMQKMQSLGTFAATALTPAG